MSWTVLINITDGHFKFWSYENVGGGNVKVRWGRIGSRSREQFFDYDTVRRRYSEKLNHGYEEFSDTHITGLPTIQEVNNITREFGQTETTSSSEPIRTTRTTQTGRTVSYTMTTDMINKYEIYKRNHLIPNVDTYKTNSQGFLKSYRSGYNKPNFDEEIVIYRLSEVVDPNLKSKVKQYYNRLSRDIPFERLTDANLPTYFTIFNKKKRKIDCIGIYSLHRNQGYSDFISIKVKTNNRISLLKFIMYKMSVVTNTDYIVFKIKGTKLKEIKEIAPFYQSITTTSITYKKIDLKTNFASTTERPKRWIE